jgi:Immunity protein 17
LGGAYRTINGNYPHHSKQIKRMNIEDIFDNIRSKPRLAYGITISIFVLLLVGYIRKWKWATDPIGNRKSKILVQWFGFENYRKIMIVILIIGIGALLFLFVNS